MFSSGLLRAADVMTDYFSLHLDIYHVSKLSNLST